MVNRTNGAGPRTVWREGVALAAPRAPRSGRRGEPRTCNPLLLEERGKQQIARATLEESLGNWQETAFSLSHGARSFLEVAEFHEQLFRELRQRGAEPEALEDQRKIAIKYYQRSADVRREAITAFERIGYMREIARDYAFLGKTLFVLGVLDRNVPTLREAVETRSRALDLFNSMGITDLASAELVYLAETHREIGRFEEDPRLKLEAYLQARGLAERALAQLPSEERPRQRCFLLEVSAKVAFLRDDPEEAAQIRDGGLSLAEEVGKLDLAGPAAHCLFVAAKLQRFIAKKSGRRADLEEALKLTERAHRAFLEMGQQKPILNLAAHILELKQLLEQTNG